MILIENILAKPIIEEVAREELPDKVLCRISYPICDINKRNANDRVYEDAVWDKVHEVKDLKEKLENRALFGHAEHPEQTQSNLEKTSHVIFEMWKDDGQEWQKLDVLDTPGGRIVDTLLRAGCRVGVSTRAEGDLEEAEDDDGTYQRVIPESYKYVTTDFTADPSTFGAIPHDVKRNVVSEIKKVYESKDADGSEKEFASCVLEGMKCKDKTKCQNCGACKVLEEKKQYITEGVWALPNTITKAKKLARLMEDPLSSAAAVHNLHNILGEDELWDKFHYDKDEPTIGDDLRPLIKKRLKQYLEEYEKDPKDFKQKLDPEAEKILKGLVEHKTIETSIKEGLIKVDTKIKYEDKDFKVTAIDEAVSSITIAPDSEDRHVKIEQSGVHVDGNPSVVVDKDGTVTILKPLETAGTDEAPEAEVAAEPSSPAEDDNTGLGMPAVEVEDVIPEGKKQPEAIKVGDTIKLTKEALETYYKLKEGKVDWLIDNIEFDANNIVEGKIEESGITIALDDGTTVSIEDPSAVNITVTAPAPAEEIEPVRPPEKEIEDMEAAGPLPITGGIPEEESPESKEKVEEGVPEEHQKRIAIRTLKLADEVVGVMGGMNKEEAREFLKRQGWSDERIAKLEESKDEILERIFPTEGGISDKIALGNLLRCKEGTDWVVKEVSNMNLTVTQPGAPATEKVISWDNVGDFGFTKISEKVEREEGPAIVVRAYESGWRVFITGDKKDRLLRVCEDKEEAVKFAKEFAGNVDIPYKGIVETKVDEGFKTDLKNKDKAAVKVNIDAITDKLLKGESLLPSEKRYWDDYFAAVDALETKTDESEKVDERIWNVEYEDGTDRQVTGVDSEEEAIKVSKELDPKLKIKKVSLVKESKSISTSSKEIINLRVKEASVRAERDKAAELLDEITDEQKQLEEKVRQEKLFEVKVLVKKINKTMEAKEQEVDALRTKLEEKAKFVSDLKERIKEQNELVVQLAEKLEETHANLSNDIKSLKESALATKDTHQKDLSEAEEKYQKELSETAKSLEEKIEKVKEETAKRVKEEVTKEFVKSFVEFKLSETNLKVDDNSRALLENCKTLEEVDDLLDEITDASRRSALHSESISGVHVVVQEIVDPEKAEAERQVGNVFEGMGMRKGKK